MFHELAGGWAGATEVAVSWLADCGSHLGTLGAELPLGSMHGLFRLGVVGMVGGKPIRRLMVWFRPFGPTPVGLEEFGLKTVWEESTADLRGQPQPADRCLCHSAARDL